jgi:triacylglycerol lipase
MPTDKTYPILLAHGIARFDVLSNGLFKIDNDDKDDDKHYFRNIRTHLQSHGYTVRHTNVDWAGSLKKRAEDLKPQVEAILSEFDVPKVHIIGHSMGGLDTRQMLWANRGEKVHEKIASLTTIGTPHRGSSFADFLTKNLKDTSDFGMAFAGVRDLTTTAMAKFNDKTAGFEDDCGVQFHAYAGQQRALYIFTPLKFPSAVIEKKEGPNDGFVSVKSARWRKRYFVEPVLDADHLNQIGWWDISEVWHGVDPKQLEDRIKALYLGICDGLAAKFPTRAETAVS